MTGRFAPSPTGDLHVGNLRTAVASWLDARTAAGEWLVRFEDLDAAVARRETGVDQLRALAALGMEPDAPPLWQSDVVERYDEAIDRLVEQDALYQCFCSRREIRAAVAAAAQAPNGPAGAPYPGTCSELTSAERSRRAEDRPPALRFRSHGAEVTVVDHNSGHHSFVVDDFVVRRNDGVAAYNLVVVVDDSAQGVTSIVRADDLLSSAARQMLVADALALGEFRYAHVPLVVNSDGERLTKRDGAMTLPQVAERGWSADRVLTWLAASMGLADADEPVDMATLLERWPDRPSVTEWHNTWLPPS